MTIFVSDLHLTASRPNATARFEALLEGPLRSAGRLVLLGDLFEYWAGDDDLTDPFNARVVAALRKAARVCPVLFMPGNRDFLAGHAFAGATGVQLLTDPMSIEMDGRRILLLHGDTLCTDDIEYQRFRVECRSPAWRDALLAVPLAERRRRIEEMREESEAQKQVKNAAIMDVNEAAVVEAFRRSGCDVMIHGHTHRPGQHIHQVDGRSCKRFVLGAWYEQASYLRLDGSDRTLEPLPW